MYILDKERARKILLKQKIAPNQVEDLLKHYPPIHESLGILIDQWLTDQTVSEKVIEGISLKDIMEKRHCHFLIAVRDMSKLLDPKLTVEKREQWRRILTTPVYYE